MALTNLTIRKLPAPPKGQKVHWDGTLPGFGVRVSHGGSKTFVLKYREHGRQTFKTIGRYPVLSLSEARDEAKRHLAALTLGKATVGPRSSGATSTCSITAPSKIGGACQISRYSS